MLEGQQFKEVSLESSTRNIKEIRQGQMDSTPSVDGNHNQPEQNEISLHTNSRKYIRQSLVAVFIIAVLYIIFGTESASSSLNPHLSNSRSRLPRIIWLYSYSQWEGLDAVSQVHFHYLNHTAVMSGYEVRIVNSWTAYDWLKYDTINSITQTVQSTKIDETVCNLLKLALLLEHGGIMIGRPNFILPQNNFLWIQKMFNPEQNGTQYRMLPSLAEVYVPVARPRNNFNYYFDQSIIAAVPDSYFLKKTLEILTQKVILKGQISFNEIFGFFRKNNEENIDYIPNSLASCMTSIIYGFNQEQSFLIDPYRHFKIQAKHISNLINFDDIDSSTASHILTNPKKQQQYDIFLNTYQGVKQFIEPLLTDSFYEPIHKRSPIYQVLSVPHNKEVFIEPPKIYRRNIELCLVYADELRPGQIEEAVIQLENQTYKKWNLVVFAKKSKYLPEVPSNTAILSSSDNQVRDIERAITQHCPYKGYAVLLKANDRFNKPTALAKIAENVSARDVLGGFIDLSIDCNIHKAQRDHMQFRRSKQGQQNPNINKMNAILNHFRIISVQSFRILPQIELRTLEGKYFEDRMIILSGLLELIAPHPRVGIPSQRYKYNYLKRTYVSTYNVATGAVLIDSEINIVTRHYESVSITQIEQTKARYDVQSLETAMFELERRGVPFGKAIVFNKGQEYIPPSNKEGPKMIPKIIHHIWIGGELPEANEYFSQKVLRMNPGYELKLWTQKDITRENFPITYDIANNIISFQKSGNSPLNKYACASDILRREILLKYGGIWLDGNFNPFRPFPDDIRKYQLVISSEVTMRNRWNTGMGFIASIPQQKNIQSITNYRHFNRMRIYQRIALYIAGPYDFSAVLQGQDQFDPEILVLHSQYMAPAQQDQPPFGDLCIKRQSELKGEAVEMVSKGCALLAVCPDKYPYAYGQDHNCFGVTWLNK